MVKKIKRPIYFSHEVIERLLKQIDEFSTWIEEHEGWNTFCSEIKTNQGVMPNVTIFVTIPADKYPEVLNKNLEIQKKS